MQTYADGKTTMSIYERKASVKEFYGESGSAKMNFTNVVIFLHKCLML